MSASAGRTAAGRPGGRRTGELRITGIAAGGAGVGRLEDGRVAFIHRTAPGDTVEASITSTRKRWVRGDLLRVVHSGPERRVPPCPLYARCGGCTLQHIDRAGQLRAKARIVADAFRRIGHIEVDVPEVRAASSEFEYRNRVSFHLRRLDADRVIAGFHELDRPDRLLDVDGRCLLPESPIREAWSALRREWGTSAHRLPAGESLRLTMQSDTAGAVGLLIDGGFGDGRPAEILVRVPAIVAIWKSRDGDRPVHLAGATGLEAPDGGSLEAGVFTQVNRAVASDLEEHVDTLLGTVSGARIIDGYSGRGERAARLAEKGAHVTAIESDPRAVEAARAPAREGVEIVEGLVEERLAGALPADVVIVNPPRAGMAAMACDTLLDHAPARILYVSCDPATLARDCARLAVRYTIGSVRCFDMFPQTAHVETVVDLRCSTS